MVFISTKTYHCQKHLSNTRCNSGSSKTAQGQTPHAWETLDKSNAILLDFGQKFSLSIEPAKCSRIRIIHSFHHLLKDILEIVAKEIWPNQARKDDHQNEKNCMNCFWFKKNQNNDQQIPSLRRWYCWNLELIRGKLVMKSIDELSSWYRETALKSYLRNVHLWHVVHQTLVSTSNISWTFNKAWSKI